MVKKVRDKAAEMEARNEADNNVVGEAYERFWNVIEDHREMTSLKSWSKGHKSRIEQKEAAWEYMKDFMNDNSCIHVHAKDGMKDFNKAVKDFKTADENLHQYIRDILSDLETLQEFLRANELFKDICTKRATWNVKKGIIEVKENK